MGEPDYSTLTEEERAAIEGDKPDPAEVEALRAVAGEDDAGEDDVDDEGDDNAAPVEGQGAAAESAPAAAAAAATPQPKEAPPEPTPPPQPVEDVAPAPAYTYTLPEDFDSRVTQAKAERDAVYQRHADGELTSEELRAELDKVSANEKELDSMRMRAEIAQDMARQSFEAQRNAQIASLFKTAKDSHGIDYQTDEAKAKDLDLFVRSLAADEANKDRSLKWFLDEGHKRVMALHGVTDKTAPPPAGDKPADAVKRAADARKQDLSAAPTTLAHVPGGQNAGDAGGDEFADIMDLTGQAYEDAIARLAKTNPARFAAFVSGGHN